MDSLNINNSTFDVRHEIYKKINKNNKKTQNLVLLEIFLNIPFEIKISKRNLEKKFALAWACWNINWHDLSNQMLQMSNLNCLQHFMNCSDEIPGDVQRTIRTFYDKYKEYGMRKDGNNKTLSYYWTNISEEEYNLIHGLKNVTRNIFNKNDRDEFIRLKNGKCEICISNERLTIDHWRAFSVYKIDNPNIAVLLCEKCNNIHHNYDASKIMQKYCNNIMCVKRWISVERRIRNYGYFPNKKDSEFQNKMIDHVHNYWKKNDYEHFNQNISVNEFMNMKVDQELELKQT